MTCFTMYLQFAFLVMYEEEVHNVSLMISGPRQPENDIDVYLAPLIDDLKIFTQFLTNY